MYVQKEVVVLDNYLAKELIFFIVNCDWLNGGQQEKHVRHM
jgi:hypothetical protein